MSDQNEKLLILQMLEQGKISSEEALKLLHAIDGTNQGNPKVSLNKKTDFYDEANKIKEKFLHWKNDFKNNYSQKDYDKSVDEFSSKLEHLGKNIATTTVGVADKIADFVNSFIETNSHNYFSNYKTSEKIYESKNISKDSSISLEAINGPMVIKNHSEKNVIIKAKIKGPIENIDEILSFNDTTDEISLLIKRAINTSVSYEVYLPYFKFNLLKLNNINGKIMIEDNTCKTLDATSKNGSIELVKFQSENILLSTKNSKIFLTNVISDKIDINTTNAALEIKHIKCNSLNAVTTNGKIYIENLTQTEDTTKSNVVLKTSNAGIKINLDTFENAGYEIITNTTNGKINILVPDIVYKNVNQDNVQAESKDIIKYPAKIQISAITTNGTIEIIK